MSILSEELGVGFGVDVGTFWGGVRCMIGTTTVFSMIEEDCGSAGGRKETGQPSSTSTPSGLRLSSGMLLLFIGSLETATQSLVDNSE